MDTTLVLPLQAGDLASRLSVPAGSHAAVVVLEDPDGVALASEVAHSLNNANIATLLIDALSASDHASAKAAGACCADVPSVATRIVSASDWLVRYPELVEAGIGCFAMGSGASSALWAAAERPNLIGALVVVDARPLLAAPALPCVRAPTLLVAHTVQPALVKLNRAGYARLMCQKRLEILESRDTEEIAALAESWFERHLQPFPDAPDLRPSRLRAPVGSVRA